jgi:hypothetical protein
MNNLKKKEKKKKNKQTNKQRQQTKKNLVQTDAELKVWRKSLVKRSLVAFALWENHGRIPAHGRVKLDKTNLLHLLAAQQSDSRNIQINLNIAL